MRKLTLLQSKTRNLLLILLTVFLGCLLILGCTSLQGQSKTASAILSETTNVKFSTDATGPITPNSTFHVNVEVATTRRGSYASSFTLYMGPLSSDGKLDTEMAKNFTFQSLSLGDLSASDYNTTACIDNFNRPVSGKNNGSYTLVIPFESVTTPEKGATPNATTGKVTTFSVEIAVGSDIEPGTTVQFGLSAAHVHSIAYTSLSDRSIQKDTNVPLNPNEGTLLSDKVTLSFGAAAVVDPVGTLSGLQFSSNGTSYTPFTTTGNAWSTTLDMATNAVGSRVYFKATPSTGATISVPAGGNLTLASGAYSGTLTQGTNTFKLTSTSSGGATTYTFTVKLFEKKNTITNITVSPSIPGFTFLSSQQSYNGLTVPYDAGTYTFTVTMDASYGSLTASAGTVSGTGTTRTVTFTPAAGSNALTFTPKSDEGTSGKAYTLNISKTAADSNATLSSLGVTLNGSPVSLTPAFNSNTTNYTVKTPDYATGSLNITATPSSSNATVSGDGAVSLASAATDANGNRVVKVTVTPQSGALKEYTITFAPLDAALDNNYNITGIRLTGGDGTPYSYSPTFSSGVYNYTLSVPNSAGSLNITATTESATAHVQGDGYKTLNVGTNQFTVYAVAEDGSNSGGAVAYTFTVNRTNPVAQVLLADIFVEPNKGDGFSVKNFRPDDFNYACYLNSKVEYAVLTATAQDEFAKIEFYVNGGQVQKTYWDTYKAQAVVVLPEVGASVTVIINVSLDGVTTPYTLRITRASDTPQLSYLNIGNYNIYEAVKDSDGKVTAGKPIEGSDRDSLNSTANQEYYVEIEYRDTGVTILAQTDDDTAELRMNNNGVFGIDELFNGGAWARVQISLIPQAGEVNPYYVYIKRKPAPSSNTNAGITVKEIDQFNTEYKSDNGETIVFGLYKVPYLTGLLNIEVIPEYVNELTAVGTYQIFYNNELKDNNGTTVSNVRLNYGVNVVLIKVLASDTVSSKTLALLVYRNEAGLENPEIEEIRAFNKDYTTENTEYFYTVGYDVKELHVKPNVGTGLTAKVDDNTKLKLGQNVIRIYIFDIQEQQGASRTALTDDDYAHAVRVITLNVYRENDGAYLVWLILFIIFLILAIIEGIIIACLLLKNKNKEKEERVEKTTRVVYSAPQPAPVVRVQAPQPQVQYVPVQPQIATMPYYMPQPQPEPQKPDQPVNVEVKITGFGESDGNYKTRK